MSVLYIALPIALLLGGGGLVACIYCIHAGQYDDCETPPLRMLIDDEKRWRTNQEATKANLANKESHDQ